MRSKFSEGWRRRSQSLAHRPERRDMLEGGMSLCSFRESARWIRPPRVSEGGDAAASRELLASSEGHARLGMFIGSYRESPRRITSARSPPRGGDAAPRALRRAGARAAEAAIERPLGDFRRAVLATARSRPRRRRSVAGFGCRAVEPARPGSSRAHARGMTQTLSRARRRADRSGARRATRGRAAAPFGCLAVEGIGRPALVSRHACPSQVPKARLRESSQGRTTPVK